MEKLIFCAKCQVEQYHKLIIDANAEIVAICTACTGFIKIPAHLKLKEMKAYIDAHKANEGQIKKEVIDRQLAESQAKLESIADREEEDVEAEADPFVHSVL